MRVTGIRPFAVCASNRYNFNRTGTTNPALHHEVDRLRPSQSEKAGLKTTWMIRLAEFSIGSTNHRRLKWL